MNIGIILIVLDILGTIAGFISDGGIVYSGIINFLGKHLLFIIGIIIIIVVHAKNNADENQFIKEYVDDEEQEIIEKPSKVNKIEDVDEMKVLEEELEDQYKKFKLINESKNNPNTNLKKENTKNKQENSLDYEKYTVVKNPYKNNHKLTSSLKQRLKDDFYEYLLKKGYKEYTPSGNPSTIYKYIKSIDLVVDTEGFSSWFELIKNIDEVIKMYDVGGFREGLGKKSHDTVINALKKFNEFITNCGYK